MILLKHIYKTYQQDRHILRDLTLSLNPGEMTFITGASGAGKSTLLKILSGFEKPSSGEVTVLDLQLPQIDLDQMALFRRKVGFVFQNYKLVKAKTVFENVALPLEIIGEPVLSIKDKVAQWLKQLELSDKADSYPEYLSGGEQQRVAIARALVHSPELVIADEPTGNLDWHLAISILKTFKSFVNNKTYFVMATHDERLLQNSKGRHLHLSQGAIVKDEVL